MRMLTRLLAVVVLAAGLAVVAMGQASAGCTNAGDPASDPGACVSPEGANEGCNDESVCVGVSNATGDPNSGGDAAAGCHNFSACVGGHNANASGSGYAAAGCNNRSACVGGDNATASGGFAAGGCNTGAVCAGTSNGGAAGLAGAGGGCNNGWSAEPYGVPIRNVPGSVCVGLSNGAAHASGGGATGGCNNGSVCVGLSNGDGDGGCDRSTCISPDEQTVAPPTFP
ncbi:MAG: hypothetical protein ACT452_01620 [Microthrixaceae bacterium]